MLKVAVGRPEAAIGALAVKVPSGPRRVMLSPGATRETSIEIAVWLLNMPLGVRNTGGGSFSMYLRWTGAVL